MCDRNQLLTGLERLDLSITNNAVDKLQLYCDELQKWSRKINLIARDTSAREIIEKHFLDSLTLLPLLQRHGGVGASLLDVGSGAGFPGLVLAAVMPEMQFTLIEPRQKRVAFLKHIIRTLQLNNTTVQEARLEPDAGLMTEFTFITSRAVAAPAIFLSMLAALGPKTLVILMQAAEDQQFLTECPQWEYVDSLRCVLPFSGHPRSLILVQKQH
jgi:16S rRNA (guanine527-N7)-methyltransferase